MSRETVLAAARRAAESTMSGSCKVIRLTYDRVDTETLNLVDSKPDDNGIYEGPFRMNSPSSAVLALNTEGQLLTAQQMVLCLPVVAGGLARVNDVVEIVDGGLEPGLTGRRYRVAGLFAQSWATESRLPVEGIAG
jgi:hypothetical protein